jgi:hypothetical protein
MSAVTFPPTRTAGHRPPMPPSIQTGFGGFEDQSNEPYHKVLTESVKQLMKAIRESEPEGLPMMLKLVQQRKKLVEEELHFERMFSSEPLPPLLSNLYSLEFLGTEEEPVSIYLRLLNTLDDAEARLNQRIQELNQESPASDL